MDACKLLVHSLVMIPLDYCNVIFCDTRNDATRQIERVQRRAAIVVCRKHSNDHSSVTKLMWGLHCLQNRARIQYKLLPLVQSLQWRSEGGGAGGGICPRAPPGGGRQNHAKEFFKIYILRNFEKSERIQ